MRGISEKSRPGEDAERGGDGEDDAERGGHGEDAERGV